MDIDNTMLEAVEAPASFNPIPVQAFTTYRQHFENLARGPFMVTLPNKYKIKVTMRPGIFEFLIQTKQMVDIIITTTGTREYAAAIL